MKKNILLLLLTGLVFNVNAQIFENACSRLKSKNKLTTTFAKTSQAEDFNKYDITYVKLDLSLDNLSTYMEGNVSITAKALETDFSSMLLELVDPFSVDSVFFNDAKQSYTHNDDLLTISLLPVVSNGSLFTVQIYYHGNPATGGFFSGISQSTSNAWGNQVTWTLSEPLNAKQWWPAKQVLEDKIDSSDVFITVPNHLKVGSNGLLANVTAIDSNTDRYEWKSNYPIAYYLISIAIAEYDEYNVFAFEGTDDEILVQNYLYNNSGVLPAYKSVIDQVPAMIELYSDLFGMYPFKDEKYGHTMAELGGGAMEHQTMTTMTGFPFNTTAHELVHQWFGDQVTCGTWQDIWVNEGFASYGEYLANEFLQSQSSANSWLSDAHYYAFQRPTGSIYVPLESAEDEGTIFNYRLTYKKGGSIIHMIRRELNDDDLFFSIMKEYQVRYKHATALGVDFKEVIEDLSGKDFTNFFNQWYFGEGFPSHRFEWTYENDSLKISSVQTTSATVTPFFNLAIDVNLIFDEGDSLIRLDITENTQEFKIKIPKEVKIISFDPNKDLLMKTLGVTYIKPKEPEVVLSIEEGLLNKVELYPNPSSGIVTLQYTRETMVNNIQVFSLQGAEVTNLTIKPSNTNTINIIGLGAGLYQIHIHTDNGVIFKKVIIQ